MTGSQPIWFIGEEKGQDFQNLKDEQDFALLDQTIPLNPGFPRRLRKLDLPA
jgi:hypothetical protein